jgi:hypothetical protein
LSAESRQPVAHVALNVLAAALLGWLLAIVSHEGTHAAATLAVGARLDAFYLFEVRYSWPEGSARSQAGELVIAGSAALLNILVAGLCALAFRRTRRPVPRLLLFYLGAYSLFGGFGYLLVDPLLANEESVGDWAFVVNQLGGSWALRLPLAAVGGAGTVLGYFWMGRAAQHFGWGDPADLRVRRRLGLLLCVWPYVAANLFASILALLSPLGPALPFTLAAFWFGNGGFIWAFLIKFVWAPYEGPFPDETPLPRTVLVGWLGAVVVTVAAVLCLLLPGQDLGWHR